MSTATAPEAPEAAELRQLGDGSRDGAAELDLDQLRRLLLGYDDERLERLQGWLNDPTYRAAEVSKILPRAVRLRPLGDPQLGEALAPAIETAVVDFFRRDPEAAARLLAPVLGAALRRAVRERIAAPLRALRLAATMPGLRWWLEAKRGGVGFAEVADRHTLVYRVEHVLLYHRASGMQLVEVENPENPRLAEADRAAALARVRAMLGVGAAGDPDEASAGEVGEVEAAMHAQPANAEPANAEPAKLGVVMELGTHLALVALVRGNAPELLQDRLTAALDAIHLERRLSLKTFAGDPAPFELSRPLLEKLLEAEYDEAKAGWGPLVALIGVLLAVAGLAASLL